MDSIAKMKNIYKLSKRLSFDYLSSGLWYRWIGIFYIEKLGEINISFRLLERISCFCESIFHSTVL